ncbi:hypothetical protein CPC08DRAFT_771608 [Agrocybe pediades]|nr:hypothetical protein CPC08DRAFT_771608 [Agrocybe pediades]
MLVYEVYAGMSPYSEVGGLPAGMKILKGERPERPLAVPVMLWDLITACWDEKAHMRPSIFDVYNFLASYPPVEEAELVSAQAGAF